MIAWSDMIFSLQTPLLIKVMKCPENQITGYYLFVYIYIHIQIHNGPFTYNFNQSFRCWFSANLFFVWRVSICIYVSVSLFILEGRTVFVYLFVSVSLSLSPSLSIHVCMCVSVYVLVLVYIYMVTIGQYINT